MAKENPIRDIQEPDRMWYACDRLTELGIPYKIIGDEKKIEFEFKGHKVFLFAYTGWHTGKTIKDGRGINNLLKQLK